MPPKGKGKGKPAGGPGGNGGEEAKAGEKISEVGDDVFLGLKFIVILFRLIRSGSRSRSSLWKKSSTEGTTSSEGLRGVGTTEFQIQMKIETHAPSHTDSNTQIQLQMTYLCRFEERNKELEQQYLQLREDKADVVAFLKRTLQQRTDTIHELTDRLEGMKVSQFVGATTFFLGSTIFHFDFEGCPSLREVRL